ncbi:MAG: nicotinate-nucleotide adenylyltransferase [gamma proteobacterium symbiont of Bathyaustriella thionipta]|nr:nicotinate-nucleotide adenylyltransferase [gamma proteobacterium symbiont of Bathyaustriella thionipta]
MIGVYGGAFDPVHNAHLRVALDMVEQLELDQVRFIPLAQAVHRQQPQAKAQQRLAMLQMALAQHKCLRVDSREIDRGGSSWMVDTLQSLRDDFPRAHLCLMLGQDAFRHFSNWHKPEKILQLAHLVVMQRPDDSRQKGLPDALLKLIAGRETEQAQMLRQQRAGCLIRQSVTQLDISSSLIRQRLAQGRNLSWLLPDSVAEYIHQHHLYRDE